jgi:hypothetical protein
MKPTNERGAPPGSNAPKKLLGTTLPVAATEVKSALPPGQISEWQRDPRHVSRILPRVLSAIAGRSAAA